METINIKINIKTSKIKITKSGARTDKIGRVRVKRVRQGLERILYRRNVYRLYAHTTPFSIAHLQRAHLQWLLRLFSKRGFLHQKGFSLSKGVQ
jgi:hypothetical protein